MENKNTKVDRGIRLFSAVFIFFLVLSTFSGKVTHRLCSQHSTNSKSLTEKQIIKEKQELYFLKEVQWVRAYKDRDSKLLNTILAEDFLLVDSSGNHSNKYEELEWVQGNATHMDAFSYEIQQIEVYNNDTALVIGTGRIVANAEETIYQSKNMFRKEMGQWKAVTSHISDVRI